MVVIDPIKTCSRIPDYLLYHMASALPEVQR